MDTEELQSTERHEDTAITPKGFRFLDLPSELRNCVYFWMESLNATLVELSKPILEKQVDGGNYVVASKWHYIYNPINPGGPMRLPYQPSITRACRQTRQETLPIFYGANSFILADMYWVADDGIHTPFATLLIRWLDRIASQLHLIKDVEVVCDEDSAQQAHELVAMLTDRYCDLKHDALRAYDYF